jgi:hypothetical protein
MFFEFVSIVAQGDALRFGLARCGIVPLCCPCKILVTSFSRRVGIQYMTCAFPIDHHAQRVEIFPRAIERSNQVFMPVGGENYLSRGRRELPSADCLDRCV